MVEMLIRTREGAEYGSFVIYDGLLSKSTGSGTLVLRHTRLKNNTSHCEGGKSADKLTSKNLIELYTESSSTRLLTG